MAKKAVCSAQSLLQKKRESVAGSTAREHPGFSQLSLPARLTAAQRGRLIDKYVRHCGLAAQHQPALHQTHLHPPA